MGKRLGHSDSVPHLLQVLPAAFAEAQVQMESDPLPEGQGAFEIIRDHLHPFLARQSPGKIVKDVDLDLFSGHTGFVRFSM